MSATRFMQLASALGLCLLIVPVPWPAPTRPGAVLVDPVCRVALSPPGSPFEAALQEAGIWRLRAREVAKRELEAWETSNPSGADVADPDAYRRGLLAADRGGYLRRARAQARWAEAMARTPDEACRVAELFLLLECDSGHHATELRQARRLVALQHGDWRSLTVLRRAALCNGQAALARQTSAALAALEAEPPKRLLASVDRGEPTLGHGD